MEKWYKSNSHGLDYRFNLNRSTKHGQLLVSFRGMMNPYLCRWNDIHIWLLRLQDYVSGSLTSTHCGWVTFPSGEETCDGKGRIPNGS